MKKKIILITFFVILFSSFVFAEQINIPKPVYSLTIIYPLNLELPINSNVTLNFDVLDANFTRLTDATTNCSFIAVNRTGELLIDSYLSYDLYWYFNFTGEYTTNAGDYSFYVHCNQSNNYYGFISHGFSIEEEILEIEKPNLLPITLGLITIILFFVVLGIYNTISTYRFKEEKKNFKIPLVLTTSSFGMAFIELIVLVGILFVSQSGANLINLLKMNFWIILIITFGIGMLTILSYMFDAFDWTGAEEKDPKKWDKKTKW